MNFFNNSKEVFSEKFLESTKKNSLRYWVLIWILLILIYALTLSFVSGYLDSNKYQDFNAINSLLVSGLLSLITGIISFFYGIEVSNKKVDPKIEQIQQITKL